MAKQKFGRIAVFLICCLILSGCAKKGLTEKKEKVLSKEEVRQLMLDHIEEKYDEEFEIHSMEYKSWYNGGIEIMLAYPEGGNPNYYFHVKRYDEDDIRDDYVLFTMEQIYVQKMSEAVDQYFSDSVVQGGLSCTSPIPDSFRPDMELQKFKEFADKKVSLICNVYLIAQTEEEIDDEKVEALKEEMKNLNAIGKIQFWGYSPEDFETYILNDPFDAEENHKGYSTNGLKVQTSVKWGQVDFDYTYEER